MTEAELMQTIQDAWGNYISVMSIFVSVISAYLIVAYLAGKDLSRPQVVLVNILFAVIIAFGIVSMFEFSRSATEMMIVANEMSEQRTVQGLSIVPEITLIVYPPLALACYKFMWDMRHPKPDRPL